jgi:hypothetical protein
MDVSMICVTFSLKNFLMDMEIPLRQSSCHTSEPGTSLQTLILITRDQDVLIMEREAI